MGQGYQVETDIKSGRKGDWDNARCLREAKSQLQIQRIFKFGIELEVSEWDLKHFRFVVNGQNDS